MLIVSRPDVSSTVIKEFPVDKRFIKLPIDKYFKMLGIDAIGPQIAMINAINDPKYRFVCGALSRRTGKTTVANIIGQLITLIPGTNVLIMSPNYQLSQISFEEQRKLIRKFDIEVAKDNSKDRIIELENGSTIRMGSINQVDSCVGRSYDLIIFDEAALTDAGEDAFNIALRPTLDKLGSKAIFISTPRGKNNWFSKFFQRGFSDEYPGWASVHSDYRENPRVSEADILEAKKSMSANHFKQEYEASFNSFEGQIFRFNADECCRNLDEYDFSKDDVIMGLDIGFKDATAGIVLAYNFDENVFYALDEYLMSEKTTDQHAAAVKELEAKFSSVDSDYKTKKEALEATYVAKIKKVECLQVKLEDEVKKATAAITEAEAKELSANALAASFAGRDKKLSAAEKEVAALRLELSTSLAEYNEKIAKLKAVMV